MKKNIKTTTTQKIFRHLLALFMIYADFSDLTLSNPILNNDNLAAN
jgi:hypothetical protein